MNGFDFQQITGSPYFVWVIVGIVAVVVICVLLFLFGKKPRRRTRRTDTSLKIDVEALNSRGPDPTAKPLEFYGTPVRLAVVVVAPQGRGISSPNQSQLMAFLDRVVPGFSEVIQTHQPEIVHWGPQLSDDGFLQAFAHNVALPGDKGRSTKWCSIAGPMSVGVGHLLIGCLCVSSDDNMLSHYDVKHDGQWRDMIKIKE